MLLETNRQTGYALAAALGLKITIMHQIYKVDPTSPRELARLVICFHFFRLSRAKRNLKKNHSGVAWHSKNGEQKTGCRKNVLMCKCENVLINTNSIYCFDQLQIIRLAHIFISSYFQIFKLVFVEALNFWSFWGTCPELVEGSQKDNDS